ncbi:hypothetical protein EVAR_100889_1 [Eumeta japonica]|uniref:Uncharacterized protein n=1 Tax=Eumeta variegata TaxID=151549 RepID=A0A4C1SDS1_EUMVA|nr:hypothetical protein EVAR_100889_1 [Eumeta japonica]
MATIHARKAGASFLQRQLKGDGITRFAHNANPRRVRDAVVAFNRRGVRPSTREYACGPLENGRGEKAPPSPMLAAIMKRSGEIRRDRTPDGIGGCAPRRQTDKEGARSFKGKSYAIFKVYSPNFDASPVQIRNLIGSRFDIANCRINSRDRKRSPRTDQERDENRTPLGSIPRNQSKAGPRSESTVRSFSIESRAGSAPRTGQRHPDAENRQLSKKAADGYGHPGDEGLIGWRPIDERGRGETYFAGFRLNERLAYPSADLRSVEMVLWYWNVRWTDGTGS